MLSGAPKHYCWQWSRDGRSWENLQSTVVRNERRLFRVHRLPEACRITHLRLAIDQCLGDAPSLREAEFYADPSARIDFGDWIIAVSTAVQNRSLPGFAAGFERLVRDCPGWENVPLQHIWLGDMDESFVAAEPYPLCALLSGNTLEWCQQAQGPWRGTQEVLKNRNLPIWAACGGAQALAILQETGVDKPWDCPRCRDPKNPKSPVYSHIGHTGPAKCGDYSRNVSERGQYSVRQVARDPVFQGLPEVFEVMESHVGQIAYVPKSWVRVATKGPGALTENQCLRVADRYIYAAQFHIDMPGTPENSRRIMGNFLRLAKSWGGYNPRGEPVKEPEALPMEARGTAGKPATLQVPLTVARPTTDGTLDEPCWSEAARTGPLNVVWARAAESTTEAFLLGDAGHLFIGLRCTGKAAMKEDSKPGKSAQPVDSVELLINSTGDRNCYYLIRISPDHGGTVTCSYNEHWPPWRDRTWQPKFPSAVARGPQAWTAELALPLDIFSKNKVLASEIGFNVRRFALPGQETHCWQGTFANPDDWGMLTGITARQSMPNPDYAKPKPDPFSSGAQWGVTVYSPPSTARRSFLAEQRARTTPLGPGSSHPGTTGEVRLELEGFLLAGDPHARGIIWDLAVDEQKGELYVLSDPRQVREAPELRVFDRQGKYLRTIMPLNPTLPRSSVQDLCGTTAREGDANLAVPTIYETLCGSLSLYGAWWHLPQKMTLAPDGDLILSNIYRGTLWRMRTDGSLPPEGWTSVYHGGRNEPFDSHDWTQDFLNVQDLKNYMPFHSLHYPYFCFDRSGTMYVSAGQSSRPTRLYGYHWEVSEREVTYHRDVPGKEGRSAYVWKFCMQPGIKVQPQDSFAGFAGPSGLAHDGSHLIVADSGNNRLQILAEDGRPIASITHYEHGGKKHPLHGPSALAMDRQQCLYVLVASKERPADRQVERTLPTLQQDVLQAAQKPSVAFTRLLKLTSWKEPILMAASAPLDQDVLQIAVDAGASPPLVWVANGSGPGELLQLAGEDLALKGQWGDRGETLSFPRQSGNQPILNIDPKTGDLYVEDDSNYRIKQYGTVYRLDQQGRILKKWAPVYFNNLGLKGTSPWWTLDYARHFRYPEEPLFIDSIFGKDGRVYRWKLGKARVEILRFDRDGKPLPFSALGTNALFVDHPMQVNFWHDVYHGVEVDRHGNIYYVAKEDADPKLRPVSAYKAVRRQINVYDADGNLRTRGLLHLDCVRGIQVDDEGNLYTLHSPTERPWDPYLALSKFPPSGGQPLWSRRWDGYIGQAQAIFAPCHCITSRQHQTLDGKGYLYAAGKHSIQVIDCQTGKLVGEFGSYGNMDCQGKGSKVPHPELPLGTISALAVWKDRLFAVDVLNRRIVKCRIVHKRE